jgi:hypothetical protein
VILGNKGILKLSSTISINPSRLQSTDLQISSKLFFFAFKILNPIRIFLFFLQNIICLLAAYFVFILLKILQDLRSRGFVATEMTHGCQL